MTVTSLLYNQMSAMEMLNVQIKQLTSALCERDARILQLQAEVDGLKNERDSILRMQAMLELEPLHCECTGTIAKDSPATTSSANPAQVIPNVSHSSAFHLQPNKRRRMQAPRLQRQLDNFAFSQYQIHQVALHVMYLGWNMSGLVVQQEGAGVDKSVERKLFNALETTKLIDGSLNHCYSRCGRTDKGVSAFTQVLSIRLR